MLIYYIFFSNTSPVSQSGYQGVIFWIGGGMDGWKDDG